MPGPASVNLTYVGMAESIPSIPSIFSNAPKRLVWAWSQVCLSDVRRETQRGRESELQEEPPSVNKAIGPGALKLSQSLSIPALLTLGAR